MPRHGHLEVALHIIVYVKLKHNTIQAFDPSYPDVDHSNFQECYWTNIYEGAV